MITATVDSSLLDPGEGAAATGSRPMASASLPAGQILAMSASTMRGPLTSALCWNDTAICSAAPAGRAMSRTSRNRGRARMAQTMLVVVCIISSEVETTLELISKARWVVIMWAISSTRLTLEFST